ncbi:DUF2800 domain-containing protein [Salmonella enterica subsp. enterica serovar Cerro]|nr:DUF2800 domain-containing protein [Salmonella enterica]EDX6630526.1 DUF2800 domain-containing protein [Salmonella enterica subsp. enterica serovar Cerro]EEI3401068.1 DUF2800 domain-containing protein [Salmonella enterica subsp. enterica serovar Cerro]
MKLKPKNTSGSNQEHALLSPSSAKKWLNCPAALACEFGLPNGSGQAAVNGTVMHLVAETVLNRVIKGEDITADTYKGVYALNEGKGPIKALVTPEKGAVLITDDFVSQVNKYVDYCRPIIDAAELVEVESRVNLTRVLHPGAELNGEPLHTFGTADLIAVMPSAPHDCGTGHMLIVGDLKTGRHKVLAKENKQMMLYALGLLRVYKRLYDITAVRLVIFQPYAGGADEWDTTPEALEQFGKFAQGRALKAIDAFQRGKKGLKPADFRPGNSACEWCKFSEKCSARSKSATKTVESDLSDEIEMTDEQIVAEYLKLDVMRQHISDIEKAMYKLLMNKGATGGFKLVEGKMGNRSWDNAEDVGDLVSQWGIEDLMSKQVMLTPTEAEKVMKGHDKWDLLQVRITRKPGQPSIATADDKRPAWTPATDDDLAN